MKHPLLGFLFVGVLFTTLGALSVADELKNDATKKDREQIKGTWRAVALEVNGGVVPEIDARKLTVVNDSDGNWILYSDNQEIANGTSTIDPTENPKTIDFTITDGEGNGNQYLGIYDLGENSRKLCFAPAEGKRPKDFYSPPGSQHIYVKFERENLN